MKKRSFYDDIPDFLAWVVEAIEYTPMNASAKRIVTVLIEMQKDHKNDKGRTTSDLQGDRATHTSEA